MKKKWKLVLGSMILTAALAGCQEHDFEDIITVQNGQEITEQQTAVTPLVQQAETTPAETPASTPTEVPEKTAQPEFSFADLSRHRFEFASGAGAWSEEFTIEKNGYVTGRFHDTDMGDIGEGYADGTFYSCVYTGHFTDLTKVDERTYRMTLSDISYKKEAGYEEIVDNVRYIYTESSYLKAGDVVYIYLPGTSLATFSEDTWIWLKAANEKETELSVLSLVNERTGYGAYSYERFSPAEDAQMTYNSYKESYDYFQEKLQNAQTTWEMSVYSKKMYDYSDDCLNYLWNLIRYNTEEERFTEILEEQRAWIKEKETAGEASLSMYEGGSFAKVDYFCVLAEMTIERCKQLLEYLK